MLKRNVVNLDMIRLAAPARQQRQPPRQQRQAQEGGWSVTTCRGRDQHPDKEVFAPAAGGKGSFLWATSSVDGRHIGSSLRRVWVGKGSRKPGTTESQRAVGAVTSRQECASICQGQAWDNTYVCWVNGVEIDGAVA